MIHRIGANMQKMGTQKGVKIDLLRPYCVRIFCKKANFSARYL